MKWLNLLVLALCAGALATLPLGCGGSDDDDNNGGGSTLKGEYELFAGFINDDDLPDSPTEGMVFQAEVERLNSADPSAKTAVVKVDGTIIPLVTGASTDAAATFRSESIEYEAGETYAVTITLGEETASSTIASPTYETTVSVTAPAEGAEFTPGQPVVVNWAYTGTTPGKAVLWATGVSNEDDEEVFEQSYNGTATSATISGTETATWDDYDEVYVGVAVGVTQSWSGAMASSASYSFVLLSMDSVTLHPAGSTEEWTVTVTAADPSIETGAATTLTVAIEDGEGDPPPMGTVVNLSVTPSTAATIAPATVQTNVAGTATATLTAGTSAGSATVTATAPVLDNASDQVIVTITEGGGAPGTYDINAGFVTAAEELPGFLAVVSRNDAGDPSAMDAVVTVNGTTVPIALGSTADIAIFDTDQIAYAPSTPYTIVVTLGGSSATSSFTSPSYLCTIELTSPEPLSEFTPGEDIEAIWTLSGTNPPHIRLGAGRDDGDPSEEGFIYVELAGTARAYTIDTSEWTDYEMAAVAVSVEEYYDFTGALASEQSLSYVNLTLDMALIVAEGGGGEYGVSVTTHKTLLAPDGADTTTVWARVENDFGQPCPDGQTVTFSVESGPGTLSAGTALTEDGWAHTILTAGTEEGTVTIQAQAYGDSDETYVQVTEFGGDEYVMMLTFPELELPPTIAPGATTTLHINLQTTMGDPCPDGTEITLGSLTLGGDTDYLDFGDATLLTTNGEAETTVTAGSTVPLGGFVSLTGETTDVQFIGGTMVLFIAP